MVGWYGCADSERCTQHTSYQLLSLINSVPTMQLSLMAFHLSLMLGA
jgi:hypothetical protein